MTPPDTNLMTVLPGLLVGATAIIVVLLDLIVNHDRRDERARLTARVVLRTGRVLSLSCGRVHPRAADAAAPCELRRRRKVRADQWGSPGAPAACQLTRAGRMPAVPGRPPHAPVHEHTRVHLEPEHQPMAA
jgi:hypothetical protein